MQIFDEKQQKMSKKHDVTFFTLNSPHRPAM